MKKYLFLLLLIVILVSCGTKEPPTKTSAQGLILDKDKAYVPAADADIEKILDDEPMAQPEPATNDYLNAGFDTSIKELDILIEASKITN